jgi:hypothetical protein
VRRPPEERTTYLRCRRVDPDPRGSGAGRRPRGRTRPDSLLLRLGPATLCQPRRRYSTGQCRILVECVCVYPVHVPRTIHLLGITPRPFTASFQCEHPRKTRRSLASDLGDLTPRSSLPLALRARPRTLGPLCRSSSSSSSPSSPSSRSPPAGQAESGFYRRRSGKLTIAPSDSLNVMIDRQAGRQFRGPGDNVVVIRAETDATLLGGNSSRDVALHLFKPLSAIGQSR